MVSAEGTGSSSNEEVTRLDSTKYKRSFARAIRDTANLSLQFCSTFYFFSVFMGNFFFFPFFPLVLFSQLLLSCLTDLQWCVQVINLMSVL